MLPPEVHVPHQGNQRKKGSKPRAFVRICTIVAVGVAENVDVALVVQQVHLKPGLAFRTTTWHSKHTHTGTHIHNRIPTDRQTDSRYDPTNHTRPGQSKPSQTKRQIHIGKLLVTQKATDGQTNMNTHGQTRAV